MTRPLERPFFPLANHRSDQHFGGSIAQHYGWSVFLSGLLAITMLAGGCMVTFLTLDWLSGESSAGSDSR